MLAEGLLKKIGFTSRMCDEYAQLRTLETRLDPIAEAYFLGQLTMERALAQAEQAAKDYHVYQVNLAFVLCCTGYFQSKLLQIWPENLYYNAMRDITAKVKECMAYKHIFGLFVVTWFDGWFQATRVAFDRLQFDCRIHSGEPVEQIGYRLEPGDFFLSCHIPSGGPLTPQVRMADYRAVYDRFRDRLKGGILPIVCYSWLLYPELAAVFGADSNIGDFCRDYYVFQSDPEKGFPDAWRVFSMDVPDDLSKLPRNTRMQRAFADYLAAGGSFGNGFGVLLFDGETVLTRR